MEGIHGAGKGDTYRKVDYQKWSDNWDVIFNKKKVSDNNERKTNRVEDRRTTNRKRRKAQG